MPNEIIGIAAAIGLTFLLFALRHFVLPAERGNKRRNVVPEPPREYNEMESQLLGTIVGSRGRRTSRPRFALSVVKVTNGASSEEKCSDTISAATTES